MNIPAGSTNEVVGTLGFLRQRPQCQWRQGGLHLHVRYVLRLSRPVSPSRSQFSFLHILHRLQIHCVSHLFSSLSLMGYYMSLLTCPSRKDGAGRSRRRWVSHYFQERRDAWSLPRPICLVSLKGRASERKLQKYCKSVICCAFCLVIAVIVSFGEELHAQDNVRHRKTM